MKSLANKFLSLAATLLLAGGISLTTAAPAGAFLLNSVGDFGTLDYLLAAGTSDANGNYLPGPGDVPPNTYDLTAAIGVTVLSIDNDGLGGDSVELQVDVLNSTDANIDGLMNILSFGFFMSPDMAIGGFTAGATFDMALADANLPGYNPIDICIYAANNCQGGAVGDGLAKGGNSDTVVIVLTAADLSNGVNVLNGAIKFQGGLGSFEFGSCVPGQTCTPPDREVPEPGTLAIFGAGLMAFAIVRRRRKA